MVDELNMSISWRFGGMVLEKGGGRVRGGGGPKLKGETLCWREFF